MVRLSHTALTSFIRRTLHSPAPPPATTTHQELHARFTALICRNLDESKVTLRDATVGGRGLYYCGVAPAAKWDVLIEPTQPLARCEKSSHSHSHYPSLVASLIVKKTDDELRGGEDKLDASVLLAFLAFPSNLEASSSSTSQITEGIAEVKRLINENSSYELMDLQPKEYLRYWGVIYLNAISSSTHLNLFSTISMLNHSCRPTVGLRWGEDGSACAVVIADTLQQGQQLTINYIETASTAGKWSQTTRQKYLHDHYGILCTGSADTCTCSELS